uniref:Uncharacterized protein n=1 Tax=Romanomermis culicivorax TaxID=13658 RepID=A0A915J528_ROMCU
MQDNLNDRSLLSEQYLRGTFREQYLRGLVLEHREMLAPPTSQIFHTKDIAHTRRWITHFVSYI